MYELHNEGYVEGGYGAGSEARSGVYWDHPSSRSQLGAIHSIGDLVSVYDRAGFLENTSRFKARMTELGLPGGDLVRAFFFTDSGGGCCALGPARATPGVTTIVEEADDWREIRTVFSPTSAGIEVDVGTRWAPMRLAGDFGSDPARLLSNTRPRGNQWARDTERIYRGAVFLQYLALFLYWNANPYGGGVGCQYPGYQVYWPPCYDYNYANYWFSPFYAVERAGILYDVGHFVTSKLD